MNRLLSCLLPTAYCLLLAGCDVVIDDGGSGPNCPDGKCPAVKPSAPHQAEIPAMNLPLALRMHNYAGGSCVHASTESLLAWQRPDPLADSKLWQQWWRNTYSGGETENGLMAKLDGAGIKYDFTTSGDPAFLERCSASGRGAVIFFKPMHSINFVGKHNGLAYLLDNNHEHDYETVPWDEFVREWKGFGGFALSFVYVPPPPIGYVQ